MRTKELYSIRGELSQIKAQVDCLLESLERMHQQREQHPGQAPPRVGPGHVLSRLQLFLFLRVPGALRVLDLLFLSAGLLPASWSALPPPPPPTPSGCSCGLRTLVASGLSYHPHPLSSWLGPPNPAIDW